MKPATIHQIKSELNNLTEKDKTELILRLARFKKDNKELLTYTLFEAQDELSYIELIKENISNAILEVNSSHIYYIKKTSRKILRNLKKQIRYSGKKETEAILLLFYCETLMANFNAQINRSTQLKNLVEKQKEIAHKAILTLHEDLQYDLLKSYNDL